VAELNCNLNELVHDDTPREKREVESREVEKREKKEVETLLCLHVTFEVAPDRAANSLEPRLRVCHGLFMPQHDDEGEEGKECKRGK